ncbi:RmlC-like cupin domain-containing protein [Boeremia exigua]|uniref:RmlC-like cupin domain-containing protein n=1 Tax=Boeremia exigua TaxID=749465 RepID=UPI001E8E5F37|nr:RmlC-like cupin domain-containing protein [Boeremia exigua]KAH6620575.1 RmlC-like cupin domain-containing protein [Boeremia exigua]
MPPPTTFHGLPVIPDEPYTTTSPRAIAQVIHALEVPEGVGLRVRRSIGTPSLPNLTPFLMLDHFSSEFGGPDDAGAPDHPHRGQETITYILAGGVDHEDFAGNRGTLDAGDLQFMTAGRGIMHSEMPREELLGTPNVGVQLWVDLPRELKYCEPRYRDLRAGEVPQTTADGGKVRVKVISGQAFGVQSPRDLSYTPVWYLDFAVKPGGGFRLPVPRGWNAFCYVLEGAIEVADGDTARSCPRFSNTVFEKEGDSVSIAVAGDAEQDARFLVVAGMPLDQPVVQYGPFVATSREEVLQAVVDFRTGQNGFERAVNWVSENSSRSRRNSLR